MTFTDWIHYGFRHESKKTAEVKHKMAVAAGYLSPDVPVEYGVDGTYRVLGPAECHRPAAELHRDEDGSARTGGEKDAGARVEGG